MKVVIGIDVGGSTTKIVGFRRDTLECIAPMFVRATDPVTSIYGAFGKFLSVNSLRLEDTEKVMMTGVGASYITKSIYSLPCETVPEFTSIGLGGLYLSGLDEAIVVSMGTGTAMVHSLKYKQMEYLGGTGVGGGTLIGLSKLLFGMENIEHIEKIAESGDLNRIDLRVGDIVKKGALLNMPAEMTAANFGNISEIAEKSDIALGVINMVFETIAMMALFAARNYHLKDIVLVGNLTSVAQAKPTFEKLSEMFGVNFLIPENANFGPVIGAALSAF